MMQKHRTYKTPVDMSKPVNISDFINPHDCFGNMFDPTQNECRICADCDLCSIVFDKTVLDVKRKAVTNKQFSDTYDFTAVRQSNIVAQVKQFPGQYTRDELYDAVKDLSKCDNPDLINDFIESMFREHRFFEQNGFICVL